MKKKYITEKEYDFLEETGLVKHYNIMTHFKDLTWYLNVYMISIQVVLGQQHH